MTPHQLARQKFGFSRLHPGQKEAIDAVLKGHDTLAILPTGGGKSAIYQIAGLLKGGLTLVVSPLLALQRDQVESIGERHLGEADLFNSTLTKDQRETVWQHLESGQTDFLLLAPEQFSNPATLERLKELKPSLFVIDEAHCVSQWGHDFRPDYLRLKSVIETLGRPPVLALTATASPPVREEIVQRLDMRKPCVVVAGFDRPNIGLEVHRFENASRKTVALVEAVVEGPKPAIVYASTRAATDEIAGELRSRGQDAIAYHAGLDKVERDARQLAFMTGEVPIIVATIAFGMGIDKSDVRRVWHHSIADSLDSYYQEIGRAGRDGRDAEAVLFYCPEDLGLRRFQGSSGKFDAHNAAQIAAVVIDLARDDADHIVEMETLRDETNLSASRITLAVAQLEQAGALTILPGGEMTLAEDLNIKQIEQEVENSKKREHAWEQSRLDMMRLYAEEIGCRRQFLLAYFGETLAEPCGNCDNCKRAAHQPKSNIEPQVKLTAKPEHDVSLEPFPVGARIAHKAWGDGQILRYDGDKVVVVFDGSGYKTLVTELVVANGLLAAV